LASNVLFISPSPLLISPLPFGKGRENGSFLPLPLGGGGLRRGRVFKSY